MLNLGPWAVVLAGGYVRMEKADADMPDTIVSQEAAERLGREARAVADVKVGAAVVSTHGAERGWRAQRVKN